MYKLKPERSQIAASDPNHPNPFMFTGRQFDIETGLYYYRARYYSPDLGRFLQTDPVGYGDGLNCYLYCRNNPLAYTDPSGRSADPCDPCDPCDVFTVDGWTYYRYRVHSPEEAVYKLNALGYVWGVYHDLTKIMGTWEYSWDETRLITIGIGSVADVKVYTLNGIGLLDEDTLNDIIHDSVVRVNNWVRFPTPENVENLKGKECDTPFYSMWIRTWLYYDRLDNSGDINYILEGHAMHHLRLSYTEGKVFVYAWKLRKYGRFPTEPVLFWFKKGYDEYSSRLWYSDLDEWLDDLLK